MLSSSATKIAATAKDNALKYGSIAGQKVVEVSQNVTEKVDFISLLVYVRFFMISKN